MNTDAIKAFATFKFKENPIDGDGWYSFDDNWDINLYFDELEDDQFIYGTVFPVIDGNQQNITVYTFRIDVDSTR